MTELLHPPLDSGPPWSQRVIEGIRALCPYHDGNRALGGSRARVERYRPLHDTVLKTVEPYRVAIHGLGKGRCYNSGGPSFP